MEQLGRIFLFEHELYLLVWTDVLKVPPVGVQVVLHVVVGHDEDCIEGIGTEQHGRDVAGVECGVFAGVDEVFGFVGVQPDGEAGGEEGGNLQEQVFAFQLPCLE